MEDKKKSGKADSMGFSERLKLLIGDESLRSFSRRLGMSDTGLRAYLSGRSSPTLEKLTQICELTGVNLSWLATGAGEMRSKDAIDISHSQQASKIMQMIDSLSEDNRREILHRIEALHDADRKADELRELQVVVEELRKQMG